MKNNRVPRELMDLLVMLHEQHEDGKEWVATATLPKINPVIRTRALRTGLIEGQGNTHQRQYRLTVSGTQSMITGELPVSWGGHNKLDGNSIPLLERVKPYTPPIKLDTAGCTDMCETCVYRQALDILAAQRPEIMQLIEALEAIKGI